MREINLEIKRERQTIKQLTLSYNERNLGFRIGSLMQLRKSSFLVQKTNSYFFLQKF